MNVLVLCTGNICRSPMAQALLAREVADQEAGAEIFSAGFVTRGRAAEPHAINIMAERGIDLAHHRSRLTTPGLLDEAHLVIGMAREHVREAYAVQPDASARTFTLKELVRRGAAEGPPGSDLGGWMGALDDQRNAADLLGWDGFDDINDPMGRPLGTFRSCADEIDVNIIALADLLWPGDGP